jgi:hypothetical protein
MKPLLGLLLLAQGATPPGQAPLTLAEYLQKHPEENGLVVGAEAAKARAQGSGLARFGRKLVHAGSIAAVVPLDMIHFEEVPPQPPNLYDGLPRDAKVLYLMSTLDAAQWRAAAGRGIGLSDLRGEQRQVFLSLLPKEPRWSEIKVNDDYRYGATLGHGALDAKERPNMRLRIEQSLQFNLSFLDEPRGSTGASPSNELGLPGETALVDDTSEDDESTTTYGVTVRATVPNMLKKGQFDTSSLDAKVTLPAKTTVGEALRRIGDATHREILADIRVRDRSVSFPAGKARAGDLLDALALSVAGTYRKVDGSYLLVADVVGAGARKLRHMLWKESVDAAVERKKAEWKAGLATSGLAMAAHFPDDALQGVTPGVKQRVDEWNQKMLVSKPFSTDELSPEQRAYIARFVARTTDRRIDGSQVSVLSTMKYRFVLPDGRPLRSRGNLGLSFQFAPGPKRKPMDPDPAVPKSVLAAGTARPLVVRLSTADEARRAPVVAQAYGFTELWVETDRPETLVEAAKGSLPTRLFVRPWALVAARADSDQTVLGETGRSLAQRLSKDPEWAEFESNSRMQVYPRLAPRLAEDDLLSPLDPAWPARRNALVSLARTPGLAGVVLSQAVPRGYEEEDNSRTGSYPRSLRESSTFGYSERSRIAFFRAEGYDPVDLTTEELMYDVDTDTPTFPRYPAPPLALVREAYDKWAAFRAKPNAAALVELRRQLGNTPVLIEVRRAAASQPPMGDETLAPWLPGEKPPSYTGQFVSAIPGAIRIVSAPGLRQVDAMNDFVNAMRLIAPDTKSACAFDLTLIPSAQWDDVLSRALMRAHAVIK